MHQPLAARLAAPLGSVDELLRLVVPPLAAIGEAPRGTEAYADPVHLRDAECAAVQHVLLTNTLVTWAPALGEGLVDALLQAWFTPDGPHGARVWRDTVATLSLILAAAPNEHTKRLIEAVLRHMDGGKLIDRFLAAGPPAPAWRTAVAQLVALPTRVANVWQHASRLDPDQFLASATAAIDTHIETHTDELAVLVVRLTSTGFVAKDARHSFWGTLVPRMLARLEHETYRRAWSALRAQLPHAAQETFVYALCTYLDRRLDATGCAWPVARTEHAPGQEGRAFQSPTAVEAVHAATALLHCIVADESGATKADLVRLTPAHVPPWTPLMAVCLAHWIVTPHDAAEVLPLFVDVWADPTRSRRASRKEELFLTTLLAACMHTHTDVLAHVSLSHPFLSGVSAHLENADGGIRRLGMLIAELVSAKVGRPLSFPAAVWDGRGEMREDARVIRALALSPPTAPPDPRTWTALLCEDAPAPSPTPPVRRSKPQTRALPPRVPPQARPLIEEIEPEEEGEFKMYAHESDGEKEDVDEDEDEDEEEGDSADPSGTLDKALHKKRRPPVYVGELAPLLRDDDYRANRLALKHAEPLIRRKTGWGNEVRENAVDLCLALCTLQNTFGMRAFDELRTHALVALCVASSIPVADCLAEQFFTPHYALPQRLAMMHALAAAAHELAGLEPLLDSDAPAAHAMHMADQAAQRARSRSVARVPFAPPGALSQPKPYLAVATSAFVLPLLNRFYMYLDATRIRSLGGYRRAGSELALSSDALTAALYTLCVLCSAARNALGFYASIMPEVIALVQQVVATRAHADDAAVHAAALALVLVMLDAAWERDRGIALVRAHASLLIHVRDMAQDIIDHERADAAPTPRARALRAAAGTLVRLAEMEHEAQDALLGTRSL